MSGPTRVRQQLAFRALGRQAHSVARRLPIAALLLTGCLAPASPQGGQSNDPDAEYYERKRKAAMVSGIFCTDDACRDRARRDTIHAEQQQQMHREAEETRAVLEQAIDTDQPQWQCFAMPDSHRGFCRRSAVECAELLVKLSDGLTKFDTRCIAQPIAFCFSATHKESFEHRVLCQPTAESCAMTRIQGAEDTEWTVAPTCIETTP
jgi:hypothetical protein